MYSRSLNVIESECVSHVTEDAHDAPKSYCPRADGFGG